jgi:AcrR family transcriptional regulator
VKPPTKAQLARAGRKERIVVAARDIADAEGWSAVTVRRLADSIGFSQPVLYGHFPDGREGIVRAVAIDGFGRLAASLHGDVRTVTSGYLDFARDNAAAYEAMFSLPTDLAFGTAEAPAELRAGFAALAGAVGGDETRAETLWAALHGLAELSRHGRLRPAAAQERVELLVELFAMGVTPRGGRPGPGRTSGF